jgi:hypothetical protein
LLFAEPVGLLKNTDDRGNDVRMPVYAQFGNIIFPFSTDSAMVYAQYCVIHATSPDGRAFFFSCSQNDLLCTIWQNGEYVIQNADRYQISLPGLPGNFALCTPDGKPLTHDLLGDIHKSSPGLFKQIWKLLPTGDLVTISEGVGASGEEVETVEAQEGR